MAVETWGLQPVLFQLGNVAVPAYEFWVGLGLCAGLTVWFWEARRNAQPFATTFYLICVAILGGALGAKLPVWLLHYRELGAAFPNVAVLLSGRTILGGIIGGTLAVTWFKKQAGIQGKFGNPIALGLALGMAIGRLGCLCNGCCYGRPTYAAWGVDFGDHVLRHPTQLYDGLFNLALFFYLMSLRKYNPAPGRLFQLYVAAYLSFRFGVEFLRAEPTFFLGMSAAQVAIAGLLLIRVGRSIIGGNVQKRSTG